MKVLMENHLFVNFPIFIGKFFQELYFCNFIYKIDQVGTMSAPTFQTWLIVNDVFILFYFFSFFLFWHLRLPFLNPFDKIYRFGLGKLGTELICKTGSYKSWIPLILKRSFGDISLTMN